MYFEIQLSHIDPIVGGFETTSSSVAVASLAQCTELFGIPKKLIDTSKLLFSTKNKFSVWIIKCVISRSSCLVKGDAMS